MSVPVAGMAGDLDNKATTREGSFPEFPMAHEPERMEQLFDHGGEVGLIFERQREELKTLTALEDGRLEEFGHSGAYFPSSSFGAHRAESIMTVDRDADSMAAVAAENGFVSMIWELVHAAPRMPAYRVWKSTDV